MIKKLITLGATAASGGNVQAWKVVAYQNGFTLHIDPKHAGGFLDAGYLASYFSLGSFIENVFV